MKNIVYIVGILVWMETCMAANIPDDFEMFQSVRQNQPQVTSLTFSGRPQLTSLDPLKYFPNLRSLRIERCGNIRHLIPTISFLAAGLRSLSIPCIPRSNIVDLEGIHNLKELEVFNVCGHRNQMQSIKPLVGLPLKYLNLAGKSQVRDLEYIQQLPLLEKLDLRYVFYDEDVKYPSLNILNSLKRLTHLNLSFGIMIEDLSPVFKITSLKSLGLIGIQNNIEGIENLKNLEYLGLGMLCNYGDRSYLKKLSQLRRLQAYPLNNDDLDILKNNLHTCVEITEFEDDFPGWDW